MYKNKIKSRIIWNIKRNIRQTNEVKTEIKRSRKYKTNKIKYKNNENGKQNNKQIQ